MTARQFTHGAIAQMKLKLRVIGITIDAADENMVAARVLACKECPHSTKPFDSHSKCGLCECWCVDKARLRSEQCPDRTLRWIDRYEPSGIQWRSR